MKGTPISRGIASTLFALCLYSAASTACVAEDTIKVGILHSLSGTMAISEAVLKDTVLMMIADQNKKGGLLGKKLEPITVDPASDWDLFAEKARELLVKEKVAVVSAAGRLYPGSPFFRSLKTQMGFFFIRYSMRVKRAQETSSTPEPRQANRRSLLSAT
jgi:hypothetical protein